MFKNVNIAVLLITLVIGILCGIIGDRTVLISNNNDAAALAVENQQLADKVSELQQTVDSLTKKIVELKAVKKQKIEQNRSRCVYEEGRKAWHGTEPKRIRPNF